MLFHFRYLVIANRNQNFEMKLQALLLKPLSKSVHYMKLCLTATLKLTLNPSSQSKYFTRGFNKILKLKSLNLEYKIKLNSDVMTINNFRQIL